MVLHRKLTFTDLQLGRLFDVRVSPFQKRSLPVTCESLFIHIYEITLLIFYDFLQVIIMGIDILIAFWVRKSINV